MTGSHQKTCVFGTLCMDGRQFFRQYDSFNQYTFLDYLIQMQKKFGKLILFIDRARQHHRSSMVKEYMKQGLERIHPLTVSALAEFDAEKIEPVQEQVDGKWVQKFKYIVSTPTMYEGDTGKYEVTVDAKTSEYIDAYLSDGRNTFNIETSGSGKDIQYRVV